MGNRLFVGNLSWDATEIELRTFLGDSVTQVKIIIDRETGRSRGFAFAEFASDEEAARVMAEFNGRIFMGRDLRLNEAHERERGAPRSSGHRPNGGPPPDDRQRRGGGKRRRGGDDQDDYGGRY